jgi:predicted RNA-binding Zn-ribbon protein involved in translation (DUF1610 family)
MLTEKDIKDLLIEAHKGRIKACGPNRVAYNTLYGATVILHHILQDGIYKPEEVKRMLLSHIPMDDFVCPDCGRKMKWDEKNLLREDVNFGKLKCPKCGGKNWVYLPKQMEPTTEIDDLGLAIHEERTAESYIDRVLKSLKGEGFEYSSLTHIRELADTNPKACSELVERLEIAQKLLEKVDKLLCPIYEHIHDKSGV